MSHLKNRLVLTVGALMWLAINAPAQQTSTATETKRFEVIAVDGNQLVVNLPEGTREITVPDDFRFNVDGKQMSMRELKPGMKGTATITTRTTVTPVAVTEVKSGQVVLASGGAIFVRTSEGVKSFTQSTVDQRGVRIMRSGKPATVSDFRAGDTITAIIITPKPPQIVSEKEVQATLAREAERAAAPAAASSAAPAAASSAAPAAASSAAPPAASSAAPAAAPPAAAAASGAAPGAAGSTAPADSAAAPLPTAAPETSSRWLTVGLVGLVLLIALILFVRRGRVSR